VLVLLHESDWLKNKILLSTGASRANYEGFIRKEKAARDYLTLGSSIVNHILITGMLLTALSFLWSARALAFTNNPIAEPRILFAGISLTVIGAFNMIKGLETRSEARSIGWFNAAVSAVLSGIAFGTIVTVGLQRGLPKGKLAFVFGFVFMLTAWILRHFIVIPSGKAQPRDISRGQLKTRGERMMHYGVQVPLIALGRGINFFLVGIEYVTVRIQRVIAGVVRSIYYRTKWIMPDSLAMWTFRVAEAETITIENDKAARQFSQRQIVAQDKQFSYGYDIRPATPVAVITLDQYLRRRYLHRILEGDSWLTRWVKREPVRFWQRGLGWDREDPLDYQRRVRHVFGGNPTYADMSELYTRLIALMLSVSFVAYFVKFAVGHLVAAVGRPLFDRGFGYSALFGLLVGALFAGVSILGKSSLRALALGLVSGLALAPSLEGAGGWVLWGANKGVDFFIGFAVLLLTSMLGENRVLQTGALMFLLGVYLQAVGTGSV
jgi:hypothetical protein